MTKLKNIAAAIASILIFANTTHAQALKAAYPVNYESPLAVKFLGNDADYLTFQVTVESEIPGNALFSIEDKNEGELYSSNFTQGHKVQTIKIERRADQVINFKLVVKKKTYSKSFSANTKKVETTTVAENKIAPL